LSKRELIRAIWPNSAVEENNLNQQISVLRKVLCDPVGTGPGSGNRFIITDPGRGYRFVQDVQRLATTPPDSLSQAEPSSELKLPEPAKPVDPEQRALHYFVGGPWAWLRRVAPKAQSGWFACALSLLLLAGSAHLIARKHSASLPAPAVRISATSTHNASALRDYRAALMINSTRGSTQSQNAIPLLERAVQLDPSFAPAWGALAENYTFTTDFTPTGALPLSAQEVQRRMTRAAMRAIELAPDAPETLRSAAWVSMQNHDWSEAERRLQRAIQLAGPRDYAANFYYGWFLMNVGRAREATSYIDLAIRAAPQLLRPVTFRAALYEMQGDFAAAKALLDASRSRQGDPALLVQGLIMIDLERGDTADLRRLLAQDGPCPILDDARGALRQLRARFTALSVKGIHTQYLPIADFAAFLGDRGLSIEALRANEATQNLHAIWRPVLNSVRREPAFRSLVEEVGLADYWRTTGHWSDFCRPTRDGTFSCDAVAVAPRASMASSAVGSL
jgi:Tfp pilus assembly protein PilF